MRASIVRCVVVLAASTASTVTSASAQSVLFSFVGDFASDEYGATCAAVGDVDADGWPDVGVGASLASWNGNASGSAYVRSGFDGSLLHRFDGDAADDRMGVALAGAGDVDNDGFADVLAGAFRSDLVQPDAGVVKLLSGRTGGLIALYGGEAGFSAMGHALASFGDTNGDGFVDFGMGNHLGATLGGRVLVGSGFDGSILMSIVGPAPLGSFGYTVAGAGDLDADGFDDFLAGAPTADPAGTANAGEAYAFSGKTGAVLHTVAGQNVSELVGWRLSGAGDVNHDGRDDVLLGLPFDSTNGHWAGAAKVLSGLDFSVLRVHFGSSDEDQFGVAVAGRADVDLDGDVDYLVGASGDDVSGTGGGAFTCFAGASGLVNFQVADDADPVESLGAALAVLGDLDADGVADLAVGFGSAMPGPGHPGAARVYSMRCGTMKPAGLGCAGAGGFTPTLVGSPTCGAVAGSSVTLTLAKANGGALAAFLVGPGAGSTPVGGGCFLNLSAVIGAPIPLAVGGVGPGNGSLVLTTTLPASLSGVPFAIQAFVADATSPTGYTSTNALTFSTL